MVLIAFNEAPIKNGVDGVRPPGEHVEEIPFVQAERVREPWDHVGKRDRPGCRGH